MSRRSSILYLIAILLLAWLAASPYWPGLKQEAAHLYAAWQHVRSAAESPVDTATTKEAAAVKEYGLRERRIAPPKPIDGRLVAAAAAGDAGDTLDPFIREARSRAQQDPEAAMQWLQEQSTGAERLRGMLEVVALWAAQDSESALLWLESNAQGLARLETLNSGVELWAERDPLAAANWIDGMANDLSKVAAAKSLATTWARRDPRAAAVWLDGLPGGPVRQQAASALTLAWMETDPASATAWASLETQRSGDQQLLLQAIDQFVKLAPEEAAAFVRELPQPDASGPSIYAQRLVQARAENDPAATADWLQSLTAEDPLNLTRNNTTLMEVWTRTDSIAASTWLNEQPPGPRRDAAIAGFAASIQSFEPAAAAAWADTISDPQLRLEQLTQTIRNWAGQDSGSALDWLMASELEPELQQQLAREININRTR